MADKDDIKEGKDFGIGIPQQNRPFYIKGSGVNMWDKPDASGKKTALKNGDEVVWDGPSDKDKSMHEIQFKGKKGYVQMANLTPNKPVDEVPNRMCPSLVHAPPRVPGVPQMKEGVPPARSTRFNWLAVKKARDLPSGDQKGLIAPSVPAISRAFVPSSARTHSPFFPLLEAT